jgi:glycosyltransferase involved in cell wall biosynthesis
MNPLRISIIIPTFNQGNFIEQTLRSVLDQNDPALELIIIDGGSTDQTKAILERYHDRIAFWESKPDRGQSHAINKGLAHVTGDVWSYLNSDDLLEPDSLANVRAAFQEPGVDWIGGISNIFDESGERGTVAPQEPAALKEYLTPWARSVEHVFPCSNVSFMRRSVYERCGDFDESYHYSMDMEYYTRAMFSGFKLHRLPAVLGRWRWHPGCKTVRDGTAYRFLEEELKIARNYAKHLPAPERAALHREIAEHRKWYIIRRAMHTNPAIARWERLRLLLGGALSSPSLLWFRPWLGAVRKQLFHT